MKYILFSFLVLGSFLISNAQKITDANINGHVVNKVTGEHLPYFTVFIKGTTVGITTDGTGHYYFKNLPTGNLIIAVSSIGYKPIEKEILLESGKTLEVNFDVEEDQIQIDGVVVSSNRNEVNRREASGIVNIISPKVFENTNSVCLAQGLSYQPGLRVETNCQNCGFQQVRINGLDGPYSQILIDSRPIFSALAGVYGLEQIPANMVDRVEVVRGGGSALFGSNAIAGTINIITKEPTTNSINVANTTNLIYGKSPDFNTSFNASVVSDNFKSGMVVFGSMRLRQALDYDGDGFTEIGLLEAQNLGFRGYYRMSNYSKLTYEYHNMHEFRRGGNNLDLPPHQTDITEQLDHLINSGGLKYDLFSKNQKHHYSVYTSVQFIKRKSYYGAQMNPNAYGNTTDKTGVVGAQYTYGMKKLWLMPAEFTLGSEYTVNEMLDQMLGYNREVNQKIYVFSIFAQNEWKNEKWSILVGGRFDKHNLIDEPIISPRVNLRYSPKEWVSLRASYASGFRAPQAFDEDLHITAVNGEVVLIELDPDLKTEKSKSYSASADFYKTFGKVQTNLLIEGFYTHLDQVFVLEEKGTDTQGNLILERTNGKGAVVKGINLEAKIVPHASLLFQLGMTLQRSQYVEPLQWSSNENLASQSTMFRAPDHYGYLTAYYQAFNNFTIALSATYTGSMLVQHFAGYVPEDEEVVTPEFFDMNLKFSYDLKINGSAKLQLNAGVQNIFNSYQSDFDQGEFRDAGYIYGPSLPRTYFAGFKLMI